MENYKFKAFIVLDGPDGSGKSTQAKHLVGWLNDMGHKAVYIHFPNYDSTPGVMIREMLEGQYSDSADGVNMYAASVMYSIDRWAAIHDQYKEYFYSGEYIIVCDRYNTANLIHQGAKIADLNTDSKVMALSTSLNKYHEWLEALEYGKLELPEPTMVIYLSVPPEESIEYLAGTGKQLDIHEKEEDYIKRAYHVGKYYSHYLDWNIVDCSGNKSIAEIHEKVKDFAIGAI